MQKQLYWTKAMVKFFRDFIVHKFYILLIGYRYLHLWTLLIHDLSKLSKDEFFGYVEYSSNGQVDTELTDAAFKHHVEHNPHHWEAWIDNVMPYDAVTEMVIDWQAAELSYAGRYDMSEWLNNNWKVMNLSGHTRFRIEGVLYKFGYIYKNGEWSLYK